MSQKPRKAPFTAFERAFVKELVAEVAHVIESKKTDGDYNRKKTEYWRKITAKFNAQPQCQEATQEQLKKLWLNMKARARDAKSLEKQRNHTGGGAHIPDMGPEDDSVLSIIIPHIMPTVKVMDSDAATCGIFGPVSLLILPNVMQTYGRKISNILWNLFVLLGFIIIAVAPDVTTLVIGRGFLGVSYAATVISNITCAEFSHPKRRPVFIAIKLIVMKLGIIFCHSLSMVLTWRQVAWIATVPPAFGLFSTWTWPESPAWLAYMGRFDESVAAFEWLRGNDPDARDEIKKIILAQGEFRSRNREIDKNKLRRIAEMLKSKKFRYPLYISIALVCLLQATGAHYLLVYIIEIMHNLTGDKYSAYYYTIGYDVIKIIASLLSIGIISFLKRRTLLLSTGIAASVLLGLVCIFDYLKEIGQFSVTWLIPFLLITFSFFCQVGILPATMTIKGEIFPLEFRGIASSIYGIMHAFGTALVAKLTSNMLISLKIYGTFAVYLVILLGSLLALYLILPETKDRTLQDIETEFVDHKLEENEVIDVEVISMNPKKTIYE